MTPPTLLVTVDSLRYDHLSEMPETRRRLNHWHENAYATCTATLGSFPGIIAGKHAEGVGLEPGESVANAFNGATVGITTNHLLSDRYGYQDGFDIFESPDSGGTITDKAGERLSVGSSSYKIASALWGTFQHVKHELVGVSKSFRPAESVIRSFLTNVDGETGWFAWLHFMEPHYPYDPDDGDVSRSKAQMLSRKVISGEGTPEQEEIVRELYRQEIRELDEKLTRLWESVPSETRIVFCADHGELLGEDSLWGHPGEIRPELLHIPFGTVNVPPTGDLVSLVDVPTLLVEEQWGAGNLDRDTAYASYGGKKAVIDTDHIASEDGTITHEGTPASAPSLERKLNRVDIEGVVKEDAVEADLEELGYL